MKYRAVIFDLDGTLINTLDDLAASTNQALRRYSLPEHPAEAFKTFIGDGTRTLISRCIPSDHQHLVDEILDLMEAHYHQHYADLSRPYPGVPEMIQSLQQMSLPLAVLTNKPTEFARPLVDKYFDPGTFQIVMGHTDQYPLKPDPTSALAIAGKLGAAPSHAAYLGDTAIDMQTALAANMFAVGALWGFRDRAELVASGAQALIDLPHQFPQLLTLAGADPDQCP